MILKNHRPNEGFPPLFDVLLLGFTVVPPLIVPDSA
jgi:hypothetical protein